MVEVRNLKGNDSGPEGTGWVMLEKRGGFYFLTGRASGKSVDADVAPSGFDSPDAAIHAATHWADLLAVPVVYVRDSE
jgi:hypothetical protein